MSDLSSLGMSSGYGACPSGAKVEHVVTQHPLRRVLRFRNRSIDDVVNDPIVKREVAGYFKLLRNIERGMETTELENQWNAVGWAKRIG